MKKLIRVLPFVLVLILLTYCTTAFAATNVHDGKTAMDLLKNDGVLDKICAGSTQFKNKLESVLSSGNTKLGSTYYYGKNGQCWGFANAITSALAGFTAPSDRTKSSPLRGVNTFSYTTFHNAGIPQRGVTLIRTAPPEYYNKYSDNGGHSMVLLYYDEKNVYYVDGNSADNDGKNHGQNALRKMSWAEWQKKEITNKDNGTRKIKYTVIFSDSGFAKKYSDSIYNIEPVDRSYYRANKNATLYSETNTSASSLGIKKDIGVIVTGKKTVSGQVWYKTSDNYYIKAEDVTFVENAPEIGGYSIVDASVRFTAELKYDGSYLEDEPYADAKNMCYITHNEKLNIKGLYKNKYQNYWVGVERDGRLFYTCANNIRFLSEDTSNDVTISGKNYAPDGVVTDGSLFPIGTKKKGASFDIRGKVSSPYTIKSAQGFVYSGSPTNIQVDTKTSLVTINKTSFDLYSSNINIAKNGGIAFGKLSEGNKAFRLLVNYEKPVWHDITNEKENPVSKKECSKNFYSVFSIESNNDSNPFADISDEIRVTSVVLDTSSITMNTGESYTISATINPSNATNKTVTWSSNNQSVAIVDGSGMVTAVAPGTATITVTTADGGKTASCSVNIPDNSGIAIDETNFPDENFRDDVKQFDLNNNGILSQTEIDIVTEVHCIKGVYQSLKGIEYFTALKVLDCQYCSLTKLDVSKNTELECLWCIYNQFTELNLSNNKKLRELDCRDNKMTVLDVSNCPELVKLINETERDDDGLWMNGNSFLFPDYDVIIQPVPVKDIYLYNISLALTVGEEETIEVSIYPAYAGNQNVTWSSSDSNVAKVDTNGKVTGVKAGQATITVTTEDGKKTASCTITVFAPKSVSVTGVKLNKTSITLTEQDTATLTATITPSDANNKKVTWSSSDSKVAKVNANGKVTAVAYGKATITVTTEDGKKTATCKVTVDPKDKVAAFVVRCYRIILGREADVGGMKTWLNELNSGRKAASEIIDRFVNSPEYISKKYSNEEAVDILYRTMLGRNADAGGKANWVKKLKSGQTLAHVINGFCFSKEFRDLCDNYGIRAGFVNIPNTDTTTKGKIQAFVQRCYRIILDREADPSGMQTWYEQLSSGKKAAAEIIDQFVNSPEFSGKRYSHSDSVEILYKAMLGRGSDAAGKANWVSKLDAGQPFAVVINGFCVSKEFTGICASYGIKPGNVNIRLSAQSEEELSMLALNAKAPITRRSETKPNRVEIINPSDTIDMNIGTAVQAVYINDEKAKEFIGRCYRVILGREASEAELTNWIGQMVNGTKTPDQIARGFLFSNEFKAKNVSSEELVKILYRVYMNRDADPEGLKTWTEKLDNGTSLNDLLNAFAKTNEFKKVVSEMSK